MKERYSIEFSDSMVLIYGSLSLEELCDYISFFDKQGFNSTYNGYENSAVCLVKESFIEKVKEEKDKKENLHYKNLYEISEKSRDHSVLKNENLEMLIKDLRKEIQEKDTKYLQLKNDLCKLKSLMNLKENEYIQKKLNNEYPDKLIPPEDSHLMGLNLI